VGSRAGAIRDAARGAPARLRRLAPQVALVCFNGNTAASAAPDWCAAGYETLVLPSTSPAYTRPLADKLAAWHVLGRALNDPRP
jgi:G:T/U-mismatch repair DNA glycosylase